MNACVAAGIVGIVWLQAAVSLMLVGVVIMCTIVLKRQAMIFVLLTAKLKDLQIEVFRGGRKS